MTIQEVIDRIIAKTELTPLEYEKTCDRIVIGNSNVEVKKIITTFMATVDVIKEAVKVGANFIITHEPTWFTGNDAIEWLENDPVYNEKRRLIEENNIVIWRFHDHMHIGKEDGIYRGFDKEFNWEQYIIENTPGMEWFGKSYKIPNTTLEELSIFFKEKLNMDVIQIVGNPKMKIERVGVLVGGGSLGLGVEERPMQMMNQNNIDLLICGDIVEWTISSYVRDAVSLGFNKGMLVLGHERSEEMGMKYLVDWLDDIVEGISVQFIDSKEPFKYL